MEGVDDEENNFKIGDRIVATTTSFNGLTGTVKFIGSVILLKYMCVN